MPTTSLLLTHEIVPFSSDDAPATYPRIRLSVMIMIMRVIIRLTFQRLECLISHLRKSVRDRDCPRTSNDFMELDSSGVGEEECISNVTPCSKCDPISKNCKI